MPHPGKLLDLVMLTVPGGEERAASQYGARHAWTITSGDAEADGLLPGMGLYREVQEETVRKPGKSFDLSAALPDGLAVQDLDAVDPCSRAWLELLRRESPAFIGSGNGTWTFRGDEYRTPGGLSLTSG